MKYHTLFFSKIGEKMSENLSSAAVVIGALRVNGAYMYIANFSMQLQDVLQEYCL